MSVWRGWTAVAIAALAFPPGAAEARGQLASGGPPLDPAARARQCAAFVRRLEARGERATRSDWANARGCPEGGARLAAALRRARRAPDAGPLAPVLEASPYLRDGDLLEAALDVAADSGAAVPARVAALVVLAGQFGEPTAQFGYDDAVAYATAVAASADTAPTGERLQRRLCPVTFVSDQPGLQHGRPLPPDAGRRALTLAAAVRDAPGAPPAVRAVAECTYVRLRTLGAG